MVLAIDTDGIEKEFPDNVLLESRNGILHVIPESQLQAILAERAEWQAGEHNRTIKAQIAALEAQQTPRRIREALAGTDNGWMSSINTQIIALRAQLT